MKDLICAVTWHKWEYMFQERTGDPELLGDSYFQCKRCGMHLERSPYGYERKGFNLMLPPKSHRYEG